MKIVLYNESGILDVFTEAEGVVIEDANITWSTGALSGVSSSYVVVDDSCNLEDITTEQLVESDLSNQFVVKTEITELQALKRRQDETENTIMFLLDMNLMGGM